VIDKIYLVGFMAAGKSTLARALGSRLGWRVEDVDQLIEAREQLTIAEIFARHGEPYFRAVEREIMTLLLPLRQTVVATGGGTFMDLDTRMALNVDGLTVWLDVPFEQLLARIPPDGNRPLARDPAQIAQLYELRRAAYQQAHVRLDASEAPIEELADRLVERLAREADICDISS
jgi:shikimate kinase